MPAIREADHVHTEHPLRWARYGRGVVLAWGDSGELYAIDAIEPRVRWRASQVRAALAGSASAICLEGARGNWRLVARELATGSAQWSTALEAQSASRVFGGGSKIFVTIARDGRFLLAELREASGELLRQHALDRRRAIVEGDGLTCITRDDRGLTWLQLVTDERRHALLRPDGTMTASGAWLVAVAGTTLIAYEDGRERWRRTISPRDLSEVARADEVEAEDDGPDIWAPELGRPLCAGGLVYVADRSGALHALDQRTGEVCFTALSAHYPSSQEAAMPALVGAHVVFAASDETLYLVDGNGHIAGTHELPFPFEGAVTRVDERRFALPCDGLRFFDITA